MGLYFRSALAHGKPATFHLSLFTALPAGLSRLGLQRVSAGSPGVGFVPPFYESVKLWFNVSQ